MIVRQLYVGRSLVPVEHDSVLVIDGYGPLAGATAALQPMQPRAGVLAQVIQCGRRVEHIEPPFGLSLDALESAHALVEPLKESYIEVLVYFSEPGEELAAQRVQWTPDGGYVRTDISVR